MLPGVPAVAQSKESGQMEQKVSRKRRTRVVIKQANIILHNMDGVTATQVAHVLLLTANAG